MSTSTMEISHHTEPGQSLGEQNLSHVGKQAYPGALIAGGLGITMALIVGACERDGMSNFWHSYLLAVVFTSSISLGGIIFVALQYITRASWSVVIRRLAEIFAVTIQVNALLFLPIVLSVLCGVSSLYIWNNRELARTDELIAGKSAYLNAGFFSLRCVFYFGAWIYISRKFWLTSLEQDQNGNPETTLSLERFSAPTLLVFALTVTFASIDWMMSLDPHWFSSIFGIYYFSGCMVSFLASMNILVFVLQQRNGLLPMVTVEHRHDIGKLMFGFMCFWAYIAFSQYLLIWYANIPEETQWYNVRQTGTWGAVSMFLVAGHFGVPFLGLMSRHMKRNPKILMIWSVVLLFMQYVDFYWLIFPSAEPAGPSIPFIPISCIVGVGGFYVAGWLAIAGQKSLIPLNDPRMAESLAFHNI